MNSRGAEGTDESAGFPLNPGEEPEFRGNPAEPASPDEPAARENPGIEGKSVKPQ